MLVKTCTYLTKLFIVTNLVIACTDNRNPVLVIRDNLLNEIEMHYGIEPKDSLKLKAGIFLIDNAVYHYTLNPLANRKNAIHTFQYFSTLSVYEKLKLTDSDISDILDTIPVNLDIAPPILDIHEISAQFIIDEIENSYPLWKKYWSDVYSFDDFCEFVLPYRALDEPIQPWRTELNNLLKDKVALNTGLIEVANYLFEGNRTKNIYDIPYIFYNKGFEKYGNQSFGEMLQSTMGTCIDKSTFNVYKLRAFGLPGAVDIDLENYHTNATLIPGLNVRMIEFNPAVHLQNRRRAKIYRYHFSKTKESLPNIMPEATDIPPQFKNPYIVDVTAQYFPVRDIEVELEKISQNNKLVYLCTFTPKGGNLRAVAWSNDIFNNTVSFTDVNYGSRPYRDTLNNGYESRLERAGQGDGSIYIISTYDNGNFETISKPFIVYKDSLVYLNTEKTITHNVELDRKFCIFPMLRIERWIDTFMKAKIQASNNADFNDAATLCTIDTPPDYTENTIDLKKTDAYKYWRILMHESSDYLNVAELYFVGNNSANEKFISSSLDIDESFLQRLQDKNPLSFVEIKKDTIKGNGDLWIGKAFDKPVRLNKIIYQPRNDGNHIEIGDTYRLEYWNGENWEYIDHKVADSHMVKFDNVPQGCLYILRNLSKGIEEQVFTYENGKQVWR
jgi:hypothetical protein